jgi:hypothetical protein
MIIEKLKSLSLLGGKRNPTTEQLREAADILATEIIDAQHALDKILEQRNDEYLAAMAKGDEPAIDSLRKRVVDAERTLGELQAAYSAAGVRLKAAEAREADEAMRVQWAQASALVEARNDAGARLEAALDNVAATLKELSELEIQIYRALPTPPDRPPMYWGDTGLEYLVSLHLAAHAPPFFARVRGLNSVDQVLAGPSLADHVRASGTEALSANKKFELNETTAA